MRDDGRTRLRKAGIASYTLAIAVICLVSVPSLAQQGAPDDVWVNECKKEGVLLDQAAALEKEGKSKEALDKYLFVLSSAENGVVFFCSASPSCPVKTYLSCKSVARRRIAEMPLTIREFYALKCSGQAQNLLAKAGQAGSVEALNGIATRFPGTVHARNAACLAGDLAAERGEFGLAADFFKSAAGNSTPFSVEWMRSNVKQALCLARAGRTREINTMLDEVEWAKRSYSHPGMIILPLSVFSQFARTAISVPVEFAAGIRMSYESAIRASACIAESSAYGGHIRENRFNQLAPDACFDEKTAWRIKLPSLPLTPENTLKSGGTGEPPALIVPAMRCLGKLVPNVRPFFGQNDLFLTDGGEAFRIDVENGACARLVGNATDGRSRPESFLVPACGAVSGDMMFFMVAGKSVEQGLMKHDIAAFRTASGNGIVPAWNTGDLRGEASNDFCGKASFASPPVPAGRNLLTVAMICKGDVQWHLCGFERTAGGLSFNTLIGGFRDSAPAAAQFVNAPSAPAVLGWDAFVCTNGGVAVCVSALDGEVKWALNYAGVAPLVGQGVFFNFEGPQGWSDNAPLILDDVVLFTPQDTDVMLAVNRSDGTYCDSIRRSAGNYRYMIEGPGNTAILAGSALLPLSFKDDKLVRGPKCELQEEVCGRPFATAHGLIVPTRKAIYQIEYEDGHWGQPRVLVRWVDRENPPLEVLAAGEFLIVVTKAEVTAFPVMKRK